MKTIFSMIIAPLSYTIEQNRQILSHLNKISPEIFTFITILKMICYFVKFTFCKESIKAASSFIA